jgi:preprotein translocase subunit SecA
VIQHSMITKSIERAQKKVEENNFGTRKRLLEYDDVMNSQREVIYGKRRHALFGERLSIDIANTMYDVCADIIKEHADAKDYESFNLDLIRNFSIESPIAREEFLKGGKHLEDTVFDAAYAHYQHKSKQIAESAFPVVKNVYEKSAHMYENIVIPFTDGMKTMQVLANLKKAYETQGRELITSFEKGVILAIIDEAWKEHLRELDELKQSVQNAVYEQKDPLLVYKFESFELFRQMINKLNRDITSFLVKAYLPQENQQQVREVQTTTTQAPQRYQTNRTDDTPGNMPAPGQSSAPDPELEKPKLQPIRVEKSVGRNDPCPCGSGKKFKQCHGAA